MAQIYVNSGFVKPKSIHIWNSSAQLWVKDRVGYVRVNNKWIPFIEYTKWVYEEGIEHIPMAEGMKTDTFFRVLTRYTDYFSVSYISDTNQSYDTGIVLTKEKIDFTRYNKLCVDWAMDSKTNSYVYLSTSNSLGPGGRWGDPRGPLVHRETSVTGSARRVTTLDVSSIIGEYHISFHSFFKSFGSTGRTNIYSIWLE